MKGTERIKIATEQAHALIGSNLREIVNSINELRISKEDILSLIKESGQYTLIYFK